MNFFEKKLLASGFKHISVNCVIEYNSKLLLIERANNPHRGKFCPIGGKLNAYEAPSEGLIREVNEETGINLKSFKLFGIMVESSPNEHNWVNFIYYSSFKSLPELETMNTIEGRLNWVSWYDLENIPLPETDIHIYRNIRRGQPFIFDVSFDANNKIKKMGNVLMEQIEV
ncbi:NUDIX domain-containing protein [Gracilimonas sp.]|uniref:NUDIX domain-containing protein n=1 Tax=Gracilimonas sp. TaxID=1974203 RepID=UPI0032EFE9CA